MRKLDKTLYITTPDAYLSLDGDNIVLLREGETPARRPLHNIEAVVVMSYVGASPAFLGRCAKDGIAVSFLTPQGRFLARLQGAATGNILLRREQYRIADDPQRSAAYARNFIVGKLMNGRYVVERARRDHALRLDTETLGKISRQLLDTAREVRTCVSLDRLRGLEGEAAAGYFSVFDDLILQQKTEFSFTGRVKHPALDPVNALLSFSYTLLLHDCAAALETVGLDPYAGFLHRDRPGRQSLACDLMEELRPILCDRFVLTLINKRILSGKDFIQKEDGVALLTDKGRQTFLKQWDDRKRDETRHPFLEEKLPWGLVPHAQALLLARAIRGDLDGYPPFLQPC